MDKNLRIPYKGGKQKHAAILLDRMLEIKPKAKVFYDLFGGGASMSFEALRRGMTVHYNEIDTGMCNLLAFIRDNKEHSKHGFFPESWYNFVGREDFMVCKGKTDAYSQFVKVIYSFGNNGRDYLFNRDREQYKKAFHNLVLFGEDTLDFMQDYSTRLVKEKYGVDVVLNLDFPVGKNYTERRLNVRKQINVFEKNCNVAQLRALQNLEQLEQLERLQQLERLWGNIITNKLKITNKSFDCVQVEGDCEDVIIYLDPPYRGTDKYTHDLSHDIVASFMVQSPYQCFLSEYSAPFESVLDIHTRSTMASASNRTKAVERLFVNKV